MQFSEILGQNSMNLYKVPIVQIDMKIVHLIRQAYYRYDIYKEYYHHLVRCPHRDIYSVHTSQNMADQ